MRQPLAHARGTVPVFKWRFVMSGKSANTFLGLLVGVFALFATPWVLAQTGGGGSIQGTITDSGGSIVRGATVVATNVATRVESARQTNEAGLYVISPLPPGEYTVSVSATGFQTLIQEKVIVDALSAVSVNLTLKVGNVADTVTVADAPAQLNTTDARLGTTIRNELYTNLPLAMGTAVAGSGIGQGPRNPGAFIFLLPGVSEGNRWGTINGAQGFSKDVFIEGVPITDPIQQGEGRTISLGVSVEAVEQFQVETSGTGVEFNGQGPKNIRSKQEGTRFTVRGLSTSEITFSKPRDSSRRFVRSSIKTNSAAHSGDRSSRKSSSSSFPTMGGAIGSSAPHSSRRSQRLKCDRGISANCRWPSTTH